MIAAGRRSQATAAENAERCSSVSPDTVWSQARYGPWATRDASSRVCEGGSNGAPDRRDGLGLPVGTEAAPQHSGSGRAERADPAPRRGAGRWATGSRSRSRRDVPECRGKKASRFGIRVTHPARGRTKTEAEGPTKTTGLRSSGWLVAGPGGPASGSVSTQRKRPFGQQLLEKRQRRPAFLPTRTARIYGLKVSMA